MFWDLTIRELYREFVVAKQRREDEHGRDMTVAWTIAALQRQKKLPSLASLTERGRVRASQPSLEQQRAVLHLLSAKYGIPLRTRKKARG